MRLLGLANTEHSSTTKIVWPWGWKAAFVLGMTLGLAIASTMMHTWHVLADFLTWTAIAVRHFGGIFGNTGVRHWFASIAHSLDSAAKTLDRTGS